MWLSETGFLLLSGSQLNLMYRGKLETDGRRTKTVKGAKYMVIGGNQTSGGEHTLSIYGCLTIMLYT